MTTERQTDANRQNAHASTGPRTPEGKAKVSRNAEKRGLFSRHAVIEGEDAAEFDTLAKGMRHATPRAVRLCLPTSTCRSLPWYPRFTFRSDVSVVVAPEKRRRRRNSQGRCLSRCPKSI